MTDQRWPLLFGLLFAMVSPCLEAQGQRSLAELLASRASITTHVAEDSIPSVPQTVENAMRQMATAASVIFVGEVTSIRRTSSAVEILWLVREPIRGVTESTFVMREWQGLWGDGSPRYVVGQQSLVLLQSSSAAGFCSPVPDGVLPVRGDTGSSTVDVRWVMTHVQRASMLAPGGALPVRTFGALLQQEEPALFAAKSMAVRIATEDQQKQDGSHLDLTVVTSLLKAWTNTGRGVS